MLTLKSIPIRNTDPNEPETVQARNERLVKEMMDAQWPPKPPKYLAEDFPMTVVSGGVEVHRFETLACYNAEQANLRLNASAALQQGILKRKLREKKEELAELEALTASTGEYN